MYLVVVGLTVDITQTVGVITGITVNNPGTGYATGDVVSIVNSSGETGRDAVITVTASGNIDTLYLTNVRVQFQREIWFIMILIPLKFLLPILMF